MEQGDSYREAARKCQVKWSTVYKAVRRHEAQTAELEAGEDVSKLVQAKARIAVVIGIERILRDLPTCKETYVAPWTWTAARLAGMADGIPTESGVTDGVAKLLSALGTRASVTAAISVQTGDIVANPAPNTLDIAALGENP